MNDEQTQTATQTAGPLTVGFDSNGYLSVEPIAVFIDHGGARNITDEDRSNARLLAAAYNGYDKHCGPRAVECAEADLLGEALTVCEMLLNGDGHGGDLTEATAKAVIANAKGTTP